MHIWSVAQQLLTQFWHAAVPVARAGWELAVRQVLIQGIVAGFWFVVWVGIAVACTMIALRMATVIRRYPPSGDVNDPPPALLWIPWTAGVILVGWVIGTQLSGQLQTTLNDLLNPNWQAILLLRHLVMGK